MKSINHKQLAQYLKDQFLSFSSGFSKKAFAFGCIEPDLNPFSYLKGSFRNRMLRGHNFGSSRRLLERLSGRLQRTNRWNALNCYRLGKLTHYVSDAFTAAHNEFFTGSLREHRSYEFSLGSVFPSYLRAPADDGAPQRGGLWPELLSLHDRYCEQPRGVNTDASFILRASEAVMNALLPRPAAQGA